MCRRQRLFCLLLLMLWSPSPLHGVASSYVSGDELCPCLSQEQVGEVDPRDFANGRLDDILGININQSSYGIGCSAHDLALPSCSSDDHCKSRESILPVPAECSKEYCRLNFCYVDPNNCNLLFRRSETFSHSNRFFSYATCWDVDSFTSNNRISAVSETTYRVGFNHNSGGWLGAYSTHGRSFEGPPSAWSGPTVNFAVQGALSARYQMNITEPPEFLKNRSAAYFGSQSHFDLCVYATALGYMDFCLAQYTITNQRAATTDWLLLGGQDLFLVVQYNKGKPGLAGFMDAAWTIFSPFTPSAWAFMILVVIPVLGALFVLHDYNHPGSAYPEKEDVIVQHNDNRPDELVSRPVPLWRHVGRGIYINLLSVMQQTYSHTVVTYAAQINLLGVSFFILTIIAVYTANLAAILTQEALATSVGGLDDALKNNFRICSERKNLETVRALYPQIADSNLAVDPVELGGDGLPGFNCPACGARKRVFDYLDNARANSDPRYCHAAFAPSEDLEVLQEKGLHCNKTMVGTRLGSIQSGIPVNEAKSAELISFFLSMKNDGVFDREVIRQEPQANCPTYQKNGEEGEALNVQQLSGIWIVSGCFALAGILVRWIQPKLEERREKAFRPVHYYDQVGNRTNILQKEDNEWVRENTVERNGKLIFVGDSRWERMGDKLSHVTAKSVIRCLTGNKKKQGTLRHRKRKDGDLDQHSEPRNLWEGATRQSFENTAVEGFRSDANDRRTLHSLATECDTNPPDSDSVAAYDKDDVPRSSDRASVENNELAAKGQDSKPSSSGQRSEAVDSPGSRSESADNAIQLVDRLAGIFSPNDANV